MDLIKLYSDDSELGLPSSDTQPKASTPSQVLLKKAFDEHSLSSTHKQIPPVEEVQCTISNVSKMHITSLSKSQKRNQRRKWAKLKQPQQFLHTQPHRFVCTQPQRFVCTEPQRFVCTQPQRFIRTQPPSGTGVVSGKRYRSETSTPSPAVKAGPAKRIKDTDKPTSCNQATSMIQLAIIKEGFPVEKLNENEMGLVQQEQLRLVDNAPRGTTLPYIKNSQMSGGALIYLCGNQAAGDWIIANFHGNTRVLKDCKLLVVPASDLPKPIKVSFKTKDLWTKDAGIMLRRLNSYNPKLNTCDWRVLNHTTDSQASRWIFQIDRDSVNVLSDCNYSVCTGIDKGTFKILHDPEKNPEQ